MLQHTPPATVTSFLGQLAMCLEVLFEECSFGFDECAITFRVLVDTSRGPRLWTYDNPEMQRNGKWEEIAVGHPLWFALKHHAESDAGFGRIDEAVHAAHEAELPDGIGAFKHHRDYEVAL